MRASLTRVGGPGQWFRSFPLSMEFGTNVASSRGYPYPLAHQHGAPGANVPRRPVFDLDTMRDVQRLWREVQKVIHESLGAGAVRAGP